MAPVIRKMEIEDIKRVVLLEEEAFGESLGEDLLTEIVNVNLHDAYVICLEKKIIGYISCTVIVDSMDILNFVIDKEYRHMHYGTMLFKALLENYPSVKAFVLEVRVSNNNAIDFYTKQGFRIVNTRKNYYSNGEDAYLMVKGSDEFCAL